MPQQITKRALLGFAVSILVSGTLASQDRGDEKDAALLETTARFTLHSSAWINLHHFLFQWARSEAEPQQGDTRRPVEVVEKPELASCTPAEQRAWTAALEYYKTRLVARSLTFNQAIIDLKARLLIPGGEKSTERLPEVGELLVNAMPVYERYWWEKHDRSNREWIADLAPRLRRFEGPVGDRLASAYSGEWAPEKIRIDLSAYTAWSGAYTTNDPDHAMISSMDPAGWVGFEAVFHEVSHTWPLAGDHHDAVRESFRALGKEEPDRFWHALFFYTAGELTRQVTEDLGVEGFKTYAESAGWYRRPSWAGFQEAFDAHWRPYLNKEIDRKTALDRIATAVSG